MTGVQTCALTIYILNFRNFIENSKNVKDKVFLLDVAEVEKYLTKDSEKRATPDYENDDWDCSDWMLRNTSSYGTRLIYIDSFGDLNSYGHLTSTYGVRPALWLNLDKLP